MLAPSFSVSEFLKFQEVTTLYTVMQMQKFRDRCGMPVIVTGVDLKGDMLITYAKSKDGVTTFKVKEEMMCSHIPVWGRKADLHPELIKYVYSKNSLADLSHIELALLAGLCQNGYKEEPGNDTPFGKEMGLNNNAWCASFFHWCVRCANAVKNTAPLKKFDVRFTNSRYTFNHAPVKKTVPEEFRPGSAVVWARRGSDTAGHTALLLHNDVTGKIMYFIEGNTSDSVRIVKRSYSQLNSPSLRLCGAAEYLPDTTIVCSGFAPGTWENLENEKYT